MGLAYSVGGKICALLAMRRTYALLPAGIDSGRPQPRYVAGDFAVPSRFQGVGSRGDQLRAEFVLRFVRCRRFPRKNERQEETNEFVAIPREPDVEESSPARRRYAPPPTRTHEHVMPKKNISSSVQELSLVSAASANLLPANFTKVPAIAFRRVRHRRRARGFGGCCRADCATARQTTDELKSTSAKTGYTPKTANCGYEQRGQLQKSPRTARRTERHPSGFQYRWPRRHLPAR